MPCGRHQADVGSDKCVLSFAPSSHTLELNSSLTGNFAEAISNRCVFENIKYDSYLYKHEKTRYHFKERWLTKAS